VSGAGDDLKSAVRRRGSFVQTMKAVGWSFFGVRKRGDLERDLAELNPLHLVVAGVAAAGLFVGGLLLLVNWVLTSGVAK
jgi:hypothetical protein